MYTGVVELQNCLGFPAQNVIQDWLGHFLGQEKFGSKVRGFASIEEIRLVSRCDSTTLCRAEPTGA